MENTPSSTAKKAKSELIQCGIVMPIAAMGDCSESHWSEVMSIISDSVDSAGFSANIVSNADEVTIIQKTIVQNLYESPIVVCDVSEKNPNVMFELGMRLAFDKPTIIIKDDCTSFSFDTGVIEHIEYPRDLRFNKIVEFKRKLAEKVLATYEKQKSDPNYSTFLKHFGQFKVASIDSTEVSSQEFMIEQLNDIRRTVESFAAPLSPRRRPLDYPAGNEIDVCCGPLTEDQVAILKNKMNEDNKISSVRVILRNGHFHLCASSDFESISDRRELEAKYQELAREIRHSKAAKMKIVKSAIDS